MNKLTEFIKNINTEPQNPPSKLEKAENFFLLFFTGSIIGWIYELIFYFVMEDRLSNNGFFFGPYLPIYGFGAVLIVLCTKKFKKYPLAIFFITIPVTGILEYITGYVMYEIWQKRWWDYTGLFMNIDGFVCLRSVLTFAIGAIFLVYLAEPFIRLFSRKIGDKKRSIVCACILLLLLIDITATVIIRVPTLS